MYPNHLRISYTILIGTKRCTRYFLLFSYFWLEHLIIRPPVYEWIWPFLIPCRYSGGHLRFYGKHISFCLSPTNDIMETIKVPLKSPIKMLPEMQKKCFEFFKICWFLGPFLKKQCFMKMSMAGIKRGARPSTIPSFLVNLYEETILKISFKNIDWFQICPFSKTTAFSKKSR